MRRLLSVALLTNCLMGAASAAPAKPDEVQAALAEVVRPVVAQLNSPDLKTRQAAARELARLGPAAVSAAEPLLRAAKELEVRPDVAKALGRVGPGALPVVLKGLTDEDAYYRLALLDAIGQWPVVPNDVELIRRLAEEFAPGSAGSIRVAAARVVVRLAGDGKVDLGAPGARLIGAMVTSLAEPEAGSQRATVGALAAVGPPAVKPLLAALKSRDPKARIGAAEAVERIGPAAADAAGTLTSWLSRDDDTLRAAAADALGSLGDAARPAVNALIEIAWKTKPPAPPKGAAPDEPDGSAPSRLHRAAERALIRLGPRSAEVLPLVVAVIHDPAAPRRREAVQTLGALGPHATGQLPLLRQLLDEETWATVDVVIDAIAAVGKPAVETAAELLARPQERLALAGARVAARLGPTAQPLVGKLIRLIEAKTTPTAVRAAAVDALIAIGPGAAAARDTLVRLIRPLKDDEPESQGELQHQAFNALGAIGREAVEPLTELLASPDARIRAQAVSTLGDIGAPAAEAAAGKLIERLADANDAVRLVAPVALGSLRPDAFNELLGALASPNAKIRAGAAEALGRAGGPAAYSLPTIVKLLTDKNAAVRSAAAWALGRFNLTEDAEAALEARARDTAETPAVRSAAAVSLAESSAPTAERVRLYSALLLDAKLRDAGYEALRAAGAAAK